MPSDAIWSVRLILAGVIDRVVKMQSRYSDTGEYKTSAKEILPIHIRCKKQGFFWGAI